MSNSKTIAKNTLFLYFRMFLIMGVTLYTSRVVLQQLGVSDYGIYSLVGGIVTMLGFFNAAMSSATQRYLSFDIGRGDEKKLQKTFSATLTIHILIAVLALILAETFGLWYINYKMVFPDDRLYAVNVVYQFSVLTFLLNIVQVPYNALIIARERMNIYAYVSILEAVLKLGIVFLLVLGEDKLILYSILTFSVAFIIRMIYQLYCQRQFKESKYKFEYDKVYFSELLAYSGWNLFGNFAAVARGQGVNMVLNIFYGTVINAAYGITLQIQGAIQLFVNNFQMAVNPQIIKLYAQENIKESYSLMLKSSKFSFYLCLLLVMPIYFEVDYILSIWLGEVRPEHLNIFVQLVLVFVLVESISGPIMIIIQANGNIKLYQLIVGTLVFLTLPTVYLAIYLFDVPSLTFIVLVFFSVLTLFIRIFFLGKLVHVSYSSFFKEVLFFNSLVFVVSYILGDFVSKISFFEHFLFYDFIIRLIFYIIIVLVTVYFLGIDSNEKKIAKSFFSNKFKR
ncbi:oligosaccharide flippase family protein [Myroides odoratimimus]|uniref:oligosaccharide flippase family protein n=1 Tax=Myroides odoratimimus TaxID=76832 RepID=UPI0025770D78|nr:oligosaccharide flippase family protein [Myroides odoratimimus]MEC4043992.1 oligosaccharide flippase family protein [Myroides odoratimimus]MEC4151822.1 oligosaccharide flippase family protein [Myroides odoratimimus]